MKMIALTMKVILMMEMVFEESDCDDDFGTHVLDQSSTLLQGARGQCLPNEKFCMVLPPTELLTWGIE